MVVALLRNSSLVEAKDRKAFCTNWANSVGRLIKVLPGPTNTSLNQVRRRADVWSNLPESRRSPRPRFQLDWESEVVEYVSFIWDKTRARKKGNVPMKLSPDIPLFGPRFIPPSYLHLQKRTGSSLDVSPEAQYLKPVNIVHPFYYLGLACCPQCQSCTDVTWVGWTGSLEPVLESFMVSTRTRLHWVCSCDATGVERTTVTPVLLELTWMTKLSVSKCTAVEGMPQMHRCTVQRRLKGPRCTVAPQPVRPTGNRGSTGKFRVRTVLI